MGFKRPQVRLLSLGPNVEETLKNQGFFFFLLQKRTLDFSKKIEESRGAKNE
jgi:hypothetical protein